SPRPCEETEDARPDEPAVRSLRFRAPEIMRGLADAADLAAQCLRCPDLAGLLHDPGRLDHLRPAAAGRAVPRDVLAVRAVHLLVWAHPPAGGGGLLRADLSSDRRRQARDGAGLVGHGGRPDPDGAPGLGLAEPGGAGAADRRAAAGRGGAVAGPR